MIPRTKNTKHWLWDPQTWPRWRRPDKRPELPPLQGPALAPMIAASSPQTLLHPIQYRNQNSPRIITKHTNTADFPQCTLKPTKQHPSQMFHPLITKTWSRSNAPIPVFRQNAKSRPQIDLFSKSPPEKPTQTPKSNTSDWTRITPQ